ncbi:Flp family type IVb pilin [bacterium]|jgi:Flp pilus assembly pilin Flp|nr:Flp family type IVb pilin [bacterium]
MKKLILRLWHDEQGQSTTEYILILAIVVMIAMKFRTTFQSKLTGILDNVGNQLDQATAAQ